MIYASNNSKLKKSFTSIKLVFESILIVKLNPSLLPKLSRKGKCLSTIRPTKYNLLHWEIPGKPAGPQRAEGHQWSQWKKDRNNAMSNTHTHTHLLLFLSHHRFKNALEKEEKLKFILLYLQSWDDFILSSNTFSSLHIFPWLISPLILLLWHFHSLNVTVVSKKSCCRITSSLKQI